MKKYVVSIGYTHIVVPSKDTALSILEAIPVKEDYHNKKFVIDKDKDKRIVLSLVDEEDIVLKGEDENAN
uniref:Uncharacterized protein n=1 Tax=viral metagenome TaxID=1070528 RepID=A0A6M3IM28_9ZZZZ